MISGGADGFFDSLGTALVIFWMFIIVLIMWGVVMDCVDWVKMYWKNKKEQNDE